MFAILAGIVLITWAFLAAICALYTPFAFGVLEIDPFALDVVQGRLGLFELTQYERFGMVFSQNEIQHFLDVAQAVSLAKAGLLGSLALLVALTLLRPASRKSVTTAALCWFAGLLGAVLFGFFALGYEALSDFLHGFVFEPGSHVFSSNSLTARIYDNQDMINGACFVIGLTAVNLLLSWCAARLVLPRPTLSRSPAARKT